jgi:lantibiotic biosynthesis protein
VAEPFLRALGDHLLETAHDTGEGASWPPSGGRWRRNLTGYSHGATGIAHALLELHNVTEDDRYRVMALRAFAYERACFDPVAQNWPDFRLSAGPFRRDGRRRSFMSHWCHGAPGIALSRLRAYELLGDKTCRDEALAALATTRSTVEAALQEGPADLTLCHGCGGNAQVLYEGARILGPRQGGDLSQLVVRVADAGRLAHSAEGLPWPCEHDPSLMLGLAGVGHFYLRVANPATPSVLLLGARDARSWATKRPNLEPRGGRDVSGM